MLFSDYLALPALNISTLLGMLVSPKECEYRRTHPRPDTPAFRLGRLVHCAILEPMRLMKDFVVNPYADFRSKAAQTWKTDQEAAGKTVITDAQFRAAEDMQRAVWNHPLAKRHVMEGEPEATFTWTDSRTGLPAKGRIDLLNGAIVDLKSAPQVGREAFGRDAARYHYPARLAYYRDGIAAVTGQELPVVLVAIQKQAPFDVGVYYLKEEQIESGRKLYERLMDEYRMCADSGVWPGVCESEELPLELPAWSTEVFADDITLDGEPLF